jgi:hypothetical protein
MVGACKLQQALGVVGDDLVEQRRGRIGMLHQIPVVFRGDGELQAVQETEDGCCVHGGGGCGGGADAACE